MTVDKFQTSVDTPIAPSQHCFAITPSDTEDLPQVTKAIFVGQAGDLRLLCLQDDTVVTFTNLPAAFVLDVRARRILATGTTSTDIVGMA